MSLILSDTKYYTDIANAIRSILNVSDTFKPNELTPKIFEAFENYTPFAIIHVTYPEGSTCTCSNGTKTLTAKNTSGFWNFSVSESGTWTVECHTEDRSKSKSKTVSITVQGQGEALTLAYETYIFQQNQGVPSEWQTVANDSGYPSITAESISFNLQYTYSGYLTITRTTAIDLTDATKVTFRVVSGNGNDKYGICGVKPNNNSPSYAAYGEPSNRDGHTTNLVEIDVSGLSGTYYIVMSATAKGQAAVYDIFYS